MMRPFDHFREIWSGDFEYRQPDGELPSPRCFVAREYHTGRLVRLWLDGEHNNNAPIPVGDDVLFVAFLATAEINCYRVLGWPLPQRLLDIYVEFRRITNGKRGTGKGKNGLLEVLKYFGLPTIDSVEKESMRDLAMRQGHYSDQEQIDLMKYCQTDVDALHNLLPHFEPYLQDRRRMGQALFRGRYMLATSAMETRGIPIDAEKLETLRQNWDRIKTRVTWEVNKHYNVYVPARLGRTTPQTKQGRAILEKAQQLGVSPTHLAEATFDIIDSGDSHAREYSRVVNAARQKTGLSLTKITAWENAGRDYSTWPQLDVNARELATQFPELGLGQGYGELFIPDTDHAALLWEILRKPTPAPKRDFYEALDEATLYVDTPYDADESVPLTFSQARFADWLIRNGIPWPRLDSGGLNLQKGTFRQQAKAHPAVAMLHELRETLSTLNLFDKIAVGSDGRNRCMLSAFVTRSSRNAPSNSKNIFGPHVWVRGLICPQPGWAVAYIDWAQQEIAIGAALSGDANMMEAYTSGDFYMSFAIQCGEAPKHATKKTHGDIRALYKRACLGMQYHMGEKSLAEYIGQSRAMARRILNQHRDTYHRYWQWSQEAIDSVMLAGTVETVFGWPVHAHYAPESKFPHPNPRSLANHPCQGNGAEMMRVAACLLVERGIRVCTPVHDAFLIEVPADEIDAEVVRAQDAMAEAARIVLDGFEVRTDCEIFRYPDRYMDEKRGRGMWNKVMDVLEQVAPTETWDEESAEVPF